MKKARFLKRAVVGPSSMTANHVKPILVVAEDAIRTASDPNGRIRGRIAIGKTIMVLCAR